MMAAGSVGITHHRDLMPVQYRIDTNLSIVRKIDAELLPRAKAIAL